MPSREEMVVVRDDGANGNTTRDFLSRDVENLVSEIKENLRLSGLKVRQQRRVRPSPYSTSRNNSDDVYSNSRCEECTKKNASCTHRNINRLSDDPYEMLQDLLRDGSLIKEAVRRLQKGLSPKQRYFYDSDEESTRSPMHLVEV